MSATGIDTLVVGDSKYMLNALGTGAFGTVYKGTNEATSESFAFKKISIERSLTTYKLTIPKIFREVENWKLLRHENIVKYIASWLVGPDITEIENNTYISPDISSSSLIPELNHLWIQMECCDMTLEAFLLQKNPFPLDIFLQLLQGLEAIHLKEILHRDIQPKNILLKGTTWKIGDLGLSRDTVTDPEDKSAKKGHELYQSPEMYRGDRNYSYPTDIYSLGLVFLLVLNSKLQTDVYYRNGLFLELREGNPSEASVEAGLNVEEEYSVQLSIVRGMIQRLPENRIFVKKAIYKFEEIFEFSSLISHLTKSKSNSNNRINIKSPCQGYVYRREEKDMEQMILHIQPNSASHDAIPINLVSIIGPSSSGKSELGRKVGIDYSSKHGSCVWIECDDIVRNFKKFCHINNNNKGLDPKWIIVFDPVNQINIGCCKLIVQALANPKFTLRPAAIIIIGETQFNFEEQSVPFHTNSVNLNYSWILSGDLKKLSLKKLMSLVLKSEISSVNTPRELYLQLTTIYEGFGLLSGELENIKASLSLIILLGYLQHNANYEKSQFMYFWGRLSACGISQLDTVLEGFVRNGVICSTQPPDDSLIGNRGNQNQSFGAPLASVLNWAFGYNRGQSGAKDLEYYSKRDAAIYLTTTVGKICYGIVLEHPLIHFLLKEVLHVDPGEEGILTKFLEAYRLMLSPGEMKYLSSLHYLFSLKWGDKIVKYDKLIQQFAPEVAHFAIDLTEEALLKCYEKYAQYFGECDENTLEVGHELCKDYRRRGQLDSLVELRLREYSGFKQSLGEMNEKTLFQGGVEVANEVYYKREKDPEKELASGEIEICREIYENMERYFNSNPVFESGSWQDQRSDQKESLRKIERILDKDNVNFKVEDEYYLL